MLEREPPLLRLDSSRVLIVGDTHGDYASTLNALSVAEERDAKLVFLGDYVDRGPQQLENIVCLLEEKLKRPNWVFLLRGNHETLSMNMSYGFYDVVSRELGSGWYELFMACFREMPYALILNRDTLCLHGGVPEFVDDISAFEKLRKGEDEPSDPVAMQILWNDPDEYEGGFGPSPRGPGVRVFGRDVFERFMERSGMRLLVRAHEPQPEGYRYIFGDKLLTVFSCRYYGIPPKAALAGAGGIEIIDLT